MAQNKKPKLKSFILKVLNRGSGVGSGVGFAGRVCNGGVTGKEGEGVQKTLMGTRVTFPLPSPTINFPAR